jgi:MFS family permease
MAICGIATPLGSMLAGTAGDRFGRKPVTTLLSLLLSVAVALFYNGAGLLVVASGLALLFLSIGGIMVLHTALATELFPTAFRSTAAGVREAVGTVGASAGLGILSLLYAATGSHAASITWALLVTPIAPIVLLFLPETARRELEEVAPERTRAG